MNRGDLQKPEPKAKVPDATPGNGATRRNFLLATGAAGAAFALGPPQLAHANADREWVWVEFDEEYDPKMEYRFFPEDDVPAVWEHADMDEEEDPAYDYVVVEKFDDGDRIEWIGTLPSEEFNPNWVYVNLDFSEVEWEPVDDYDDAFRDEDYLYVVEYDYSNEDGTDSQWEWYEIGDPYEPNHYEYARAK